MMNDLLRDIGEQLYGPRWQTDLSRAIEVSDRTMRRWVSGEDSVPDGAWLDIYRRLEGRATELERTKHRLSGLIGMRQMTLQPIPNGKAQADIYGVEFAMQAPLRRTMHCLARREIFDDRSCTDRSMMLAFFNRHVESFYRAASVKYDMRETQAPTRIIVGNEDVILPATARF